MKGQEPLRVVIGEDQPIVREGIAQVLESGGYDVVATSGDARSLVEKVRAYRPDVVVTDIQMPPDNTDDGLRAALRIRRLQPDVGVLVLSAFLETRYALELVAQGAQGIGYLLKEKVGDLRLFTDAVRRVATGGSALDPDVVAVLIGQPHADSALDLLTPRELDVLGLIAEGRSNLGVAEELVVSVGAVERHVTSIFEKLDLPHTPESHRRVLAVLTYLRLNGGLPPQ
ncbi:response regulator transcription factor [Nocardioides panacihumi]|uniref:response regulator transcription factor n=1 Tax=Nocardioides panacihumi TaxID=400774 RepID=UPI0031D460D1